MTVPALDTLKLASALRDKARFTREQAEGIAGAIAEASQTVRPAKSDLLMAKDDLRGAKIEIITWVAGLIVFQTLAVIGTVLALAHH